jgi:hypothetical protein
MARSQASALWPTHERTPRSTQFKIISKIISKTVIGKQQNEFNRPRIVRRSQEFFCVLRIRMIPKNGFEMNYYAMVEILARCVPQCHDASSPDLPLYANGGGGTAGNSGNC